MKYSRLLICVLAIVSFCSCERDEDDKVGLTKFLIYDIADPPINSGGTDEIKCIGIDSENSIWVGLNPLIKHNGQFWETYGQDIFGERNCCVNDIDFDSNNNVWFGTYNGLFKNNGEAWESHFYIAEHPFHTTIRCVHCDYQDKVWFAKGGTGLVCYDGTDWTTFEYQNTFPGMHIQKIISDINGNIFIGCHDALYKYDGTEFIKFYFSKVKGENMNIQDLDFDKSGDLWISCRSNLLVLRNNEFIEIDTNDIQNPLWDDYNWVASSVAINNQNGEVVIGTWNTGIAFHNNQNTTFFRGNEFGIDSTHFQINELAFDLSNNLWIVTRFGKIIVYNEKGIKL